MMALLLPVGFWSARWLETVVAGGLAGLLLAVAVSATRIAAPSMLESEAAVVALILGHLIRQAIFGYKDRHIPSAKP